MPLNYSFAGKSVLVTGGGQGIGKAIVQKFHEDGAKVFTIDKNAETIDQLRKEFPGVTAEVVDISDWEATRKVVEEFGVIDHLVNNAAIVQVQKLMDVKKEDAALLLDVNLLAAVNLTQIVAKRLIASGREGTIINIASVMGRIGNTFGNFIYGASKAGLENLTKSMAMELGPHNIRVNCILPGVVAAPMALKSMENPEVKATVDAWNSDRLIYKRNIDPSEIANLALYLSSPLSSSIVGQGVVCDGGLLSN